MRNKKLILLSIFGLVIFGICAWSYEQSRKHEPTEREKMAAFFGDTSESKS